MAIGKSANVYDRQVVGDEGSLLDRPTVPGTQIPSSLHFEFPQHESSVGKTGDDPGNWCDGTHFSPRGLQVHLPSAPHRLEQQSASIPSLFTQASLLPRQKHFFSTQAAIPQQFNPFELQVSPNKAHISDGEPSVPAVRGNIGVGIVVVGSFDAEADKADGEEYVLSVGN